MRKCIETNGQRLPLLSRSCERRSSSERTRRFGYRVQPLDSPVDPSNNLRAFLAGLAWLPWAENSSGDCPLVIVQFFENLKISVSLGLGRFRQRGDLSQWLGSQCGLLQREHISWFEVGLQTMVLVSTVAGGTSSELGRDSLLDRDALEEYRDLLETAGVLPEAGNRIITFLREIARDPRNERAFAQILETLEEQSLRPSAFNAATSNAGRRIAISYYLTVAMAVATALASFSPKIPPIAIPWILIAGFLLITAIGALAVFRE